MSKKALHLAGGGARGAYQAGVLKAIGQILQTKTLPFEVLSGVSVGSINATLLAENADDFPAAIDKLESLWSEIRCHQIYNASTYQLSKTVLRNISALFFKNRRSGCLLDTSALRKFLDTNVNFTRVMKHVKDGRLEAFEVICTCYETHQTVSFYDHTRAEFENWNYPRHISRRGPINTEHVLASSALPLFFPAIKINSAHYGDGSIGLIAPLRGAIRFDVNNIMIIGTREISSFPASSVQYSSVPFAQILGNMFNGLFLDNLDRDIEMVNRMNEIATLLSLWKKRYSPWRPINTMHLRPSHEMASIAQKYYKNMPVLLRYLLNTLGAKKHSGDLLSFLLFEKEFTRKLFDLGYDDTMKSATEVAAFFND